MRLIVDENKNTQYQNFNLKNHQYSAYGNGATHKFDKNANLKYAHEIIDNSLKKEWSFKKI